MVRLNAKLPDYEQGDKEMNGIDLSISDYVLIIGGIAVLSRLKERSYRPSRLMLVPILMIVFILPSTISSFFDGPVAIILMLFGFLVGCGFGWYRGNLLEIQTSENGEEILIKGSYWYVFVWFTIAAIKILGEYLLDTSGFVAVDLSASVFILMMLGSIVMRRIIVYSRFVEQKKKGTCSIKVLTKKADRMMIRWVSFRSCELQMICCDLHMS